MSHYKITKYSYDKAEELGLTIKVSQLATKKLDVFKDNVLIGSIGDSVYQDHPHYILTYNLEYAKKRRALYIDHHKKNCDVKCSNQWSALNSSW